MAVVLMIIAPGKFRDEEYLQTKEILDNEGIEVVTASTVPGEYLGKYESPVTATCAIADQTATDYDAVAFVGGAGAQVFFDDPEAHRLAQEAIESQTPLGAICVAPAILAHAGLLQGRRVTGWIEVRDDLQAHGAIYTGERVTFDSPIITASGPVASYDFGKAIAPRALRHAAARVAAREAAEAEASTEESEAPDEKADAGDIHMPPEADVSDELSDDAEDE